MSEIPKVLLLIEDSADDAELVLSTLRDSQLNSQIIHLKDGAEALDYIFARTSHYRDRVLPHWILLDLKIPKISGIDVLRQLRSSNEGAKIPVVVFTSSREESDVIDSYRWNVTSYLQKPIDYEEFETAVQRISFYWAAMNQYPPSWEKVRNAP